MNAFRTLLFGLIDGAWIGGLLAFIYADARVVLQFSGGFHHPGNNILQDTVLFLVALLAFNLTGLPVFIGLIAAIIGIVIGLCIGSVIAVLALVTFIMLPHFPVAKSYALPTMLLSGVVLGALLTYIIFPIVDAGDYPNVAGDLWWMGAIFGVMLAGTLIARNRVA